MPSHDDAAESAGDAHVAFRVRLPALHANRAFVQLVLGQAISALGDGVTMTALSIYIATTTGSGTDLGTLKILQLAPTLAVGLFAGSLADRWDRRTILIVADVARAVLTMTMPLAIALGLPTLPVIYAATIPLSALGVLFLAAFRGLLPSMVRDDEIGHATSSLSAAIMVGIIVGPAIAGALVGVIGVPATLTIDAASFLVSAGLLARVKSPPRAARDAAKPGMLRDIAAGIALVFRDHRLRALTLLLAFDDAVGAPLLAAVNLFAVARGTPARTIGIIFSAAAVGATLGFLFGGLAVKRRPGVVAIAIFAMRGVILSCMRAETETATLLVGVCIVSALNACFLAMIGALRTSSTPDAMQGRVGATVHVLSTATLAAGSLLGGVLIDATSGVRVIRAIGVLYLIGAAAFACAPSVLQAKMNTVRPRAPSSP